MFSIEIRCTSYDCQKTSTSSLQHLNLLPGQPVDLQLLLKNEGREKLFFTLNNQEGLMHVNSDLNSEVIENGAVKTFQISFSLPSSTDNNYQAREITEKLLLSVKSESGQLEELPITFSDQLITEEAQTTSSHIPQTTSSATELKHLAWVSCMLLVLLIIVLIVVYFLRKKSKQQQMPKVVYTK